MLLPPPPPASRSLRPNHWPAGERRAVKGAGGARGGKEGIGVLPGCLPRAATCRIPSRARAVGRGAAASRPSCFAAAAGHLPRPPMPRQVGNGYLPRHEAAAAAAAAAEAVCCVEFHAASKIYGPAGLNLRPNN